MKPPAALAAFAALNRSPSRNGHARVRAAQQLRHRTTRTSFRPARSRRSTRKSEHCRADRKESRRRIGTVAQRRRAEHGDPKQLRAIAGQRRRIYIAKAEHEIRIEGDRRRRSSSRRVHSTRSRKRSHSVQGNDFDGGVENAVSVIVNTYRGHASSLNSAARPVSTSYGVQRSYSRGWNMGWICGSSSGGHLLHHPWDLPGDRGSAHVRPGSRLRRPGLWGPATAAPVTAATAAAADSGAVCWAGSRRVPRQRRSSGTVAFRRGIAATAGRMAAASTATRPTPPVGRATRARATARTSVGRRGVIPAAATQGARLGRR